MEIDVEVEVEVEMEVEVELDEEEKERKKEKNQNSFIKKTIFQYSRFAQNFYPTKLMFCPSPYAARIPGVPTSLS